VAPTLRAQRDARKPHRLTGVDSCAVSRSKRRRIELSRRQRAGVLAAGVAQLALQIAALVDLRRRPARTVRGTKGAWTAASFVNYLGPIAYFVFGRRRRAK